MDDKLARAPSTGLVVRAIDAKLRDQTEANKQRTHAGATEKAYRADWARFTEWCEAYGLSSLPSSSETIELYLTALSKGYELQKGAEIIERPALRYWSISRAYAGIRAMHVRGGCRLDPLSGVTAVLGGLARELGVAQRKKKPLLDVELLQVADEASVETLLQVRDVAILLVGFAGALRRAEVSDLNVEDVTVKQDGMVLHLRKRKNDQKGMGTDIGVPWGEHACPVLALKAWMDRSGVETGPLFRPIVNEVALPRRLAPPAVSRAVKHAAELLGFDPTEYSAHSLRAGLATSAALAGKGLDVIMRTTGHKSEHVARGYIRTADVLRITASKGLL